MQVADGEGEERASVNDRTRVRIATQQIVCGDTFTSCDKRCVSSYYSVDMELFSISAFPFLSFSTFSLYTLGVQPVSFWKAR